MSKKFKQLLVPEGYRHYWSKYPEGYTILEALLSWVESVNQLTDNVNDWNIYLEDFVENFDEKLAPTVREMLNEMDQDGRLAEIINDEIFSWKADKTYVDDELDKKSDLTYVDEQLEGLAYQVKSFGAVGDNTADDTQAFKDLFSVAENKKVYLEKGKVYRVTDKLVVPKGCEIVGNGATVNFYMSGNVECFLPTDNCKIDNLTINVYVVEPVSNLGGPSGHYQCPITVGNYLTGESYKNIELTNLVIYTERENANGIFITSESHNVTIENIYFPDNQYIGRPILVHWGNYNDRETLTTHPYNININNIKIGKMSYVASGGVSNNIAGIFLSAVYNVSVDNVVIEESAEQGITVFAGDHGFKYASDEVKKVAFRGITIRNVQVNKAKEGFKIRETGFDFPNDTVIDMDVLFENCTTNGTGTSDNNGSGIVFWNVRGPVVRNCTVKNHLNGFATANYVEDIRVEGGEYSENLHAGVYFGSGSAPPKNCKAINVKSHSNGTLETATNRDGITIYYSENCSAEGCILGAEGETTQQNGIKFRVVTENNRPYNASVTNCHVLGVASGGVAYLVNNLIQNMIYKTFSNNTAKEGITYSDAITGIVSANHNVYGNTINYGSTAPGGLTWKQGDIVYNTNPAPGSYMGWICTDSGTPGTWKGFGLIES